MSRTTQESPAALHAPAYRPLAVLAVTAVLLATVLGAFVAITHPGATLVTVALVVTAASAVRAVRRHRARRHATRQVCVPHTGVCMRV